MANDGETSRSDLSYGANAILEAVNAAYYLPEREARAGAPRQFRIGTLARGGEIKRMVEVTRSRLARFRDDVARASGTIPPNPAELAQIDVWVERLAA
jgi:hypothetical protein